MYSKTKYANIKKIFQVFKKKMNAVPLLILVASVQVDYDDHTFGLKSNDSAFVLVDDSGWIPHPQDNYEVFNIGRNEVQAEVWWGNEIAYSGIIESATVRPGDKIILHNDDRPYYYTGLKLINNGPVRAIVHGEGGYLPLPFIPNLQIDVNKILQIALSSCVKYFFETTPLVSVLFEELSHLFWPKNKPDVWSEVSVQVNQLLDEKIRELISSLLENEISVYRDKIASLSNEIGNQTDISGHYMNVAYDLIGLEKKFYFSQTLTNYKLINIYILPLFSNVVSLKINFYTLGMKYAKDIGLSEDNVSYVRKYANATFKNAFNHITNISKYAIDDVYETAQSQRIFDSMMTIRSHLAIHGKENLVIWKYKLEHPKSKLEVYNPIISYSSFFGKPTANLYAQATPIAVPPPLCPEMVNDKRSNLVKIVIYFWCKNPSVLKIGGVKLFFDNGKEFSMGTETAIMDTFELGNAKIIKLTAYGDGKIDGLKFVLSSGIVRSFGQTLVSVSTDFLLKDHFIPSFYLSSDSRQLDGQAANIAVSFQWLVKTD